MPPVSKLLRASLQCNRCNEFFTLWEGLFSFILIPNSFFLFPSSFSLFTFSSSSIPVDLSDHIQSTLLNLAGSFEAEMRDLRRHLHRHPEPSGEEYRTTAKIARILKQRDIRFRVAPNQRGLIVDSRYQKGARRIALRADMDGLRLQDEKTVAYRSLKPNLMHACGHDAHSAMLVGAVKALDAFEQQRPGLLTWRAIFQPAEETGVGAKEMKAIGAMESVDAVVALHVDPTIEVGKAATRVGVLTAICEEFKIDIRGKGGHGARPHKTIDPIAAGARLIQALYHEFPHTFDPDDPVVLSIGVFKAGASPNVIPETCQLRGTIRTTQSGASQRINQRIREILAETESATGATFHFTRTFFLPSVINHPETTRICRRVGERVLGAGKVEDLEDPSMGGEDFSHYQTDAPVCMLRLGVGAPGELEKVLHSPYFDLDEDALILGSKILALSAYELSIPN